MTNVIAKKKEVERRGSEDIKLLMLSARLEDLLRTLPEHNPNVILRFCKVLAFLVGKTAAAAFT